MAQEKPAEKASGVIPSLDELAPHRWDRECYEVAAGIAQKWPHLQEDGGYYVHPELGAGDHGWNVAPDGTIVDMSATQHDYTGEADEQADDYKFPPPQHPEIIPPDHPYYPRYVSYIRNESDAQSIAHDLGHEHGGPEVCPKCRTGRWSVDCEDTATVLSRVLSNPVPPTLPSKEQKVGASTVRWWEANPREAVIMAFGGSADDRTLAEQVAKTALAAFGFKRVTFKVETEDLRKEAGWTDIMAKAKRLIQSGQVHVLRNGWNNIIGHVIGDHGEYNVEIGRDDPDSRTITTWQCECPWDQYAWQRTRKWKKYEGRPCSHVMALYWSSFGVPLDDYDPNQHGDLPSGQKMPPPPPDGGGAPAPMPTPAAPGPPSPFSPPQPDATLGPAGPGPQAPLAPPGQPGVLPPAPMDAMQQAMQPPPMPGQTPAGMPAPPGSVSVPGARLPSPFGPVQYPGGTYSKLAAGEAFVNGEIVRLTKDAYGMNEGREGATDAGQYSLIPEGSTGEVIGQDAATGWVEVIFPLEGGPMTSYHARCFLEPSDVKKTRIRPPGPFIKRR